MCKEVASSKKTNSRLEGKNRYPIYDHNGGKMAIIDTLFMTKMAEKPYPLGPHIPYIAHIREYPPPPGAFPHGLIHIIVLCIPVRFYMHLLIGKTFAIKVLLSCPSGRYYLRLV